MKINKLIISKLYGLYDYNVSINNDISFLYGENGCGKTTILNILSSIVCGKLYKLFEYKFEAIILFYDQDKEITIKYKRENLLQFSNKTNNKQVSYEIENIIEGILKKTGDSSYTFIEYIKRYPFLKDFCSLFRVAYLPLSRAYELEEEYNTDNWFNSLNALNLSRIKSIAAVKNKDVAIQQISFLVLDKYNQMNRKLDSVNNEFRNSILKSFSEIYKLESSNILLEKIINNKQEVLGLINKIEIYYTKILEDLGILPNIDIAKYKLFFMNFENALNNMNSTIQTPQEVHNTLNMLLEYQELRRLESIVELSNDFEKKREFIKKPISDFLNIVNIFLSKTTQKKEVKLDRSGRMYLSVGDNKRISLEHLSSGEKQIVILFAYIILQLRPSRDAILIVDEPEMSLHLYWQQIFVDMIQRAKPNLQIIFATHAPELIGRRDEKMVELIRERDVI